MSTETEIVLITGNAGKCKEFTEIFASLGLPFTFKNQKIDLTEIQARTSEEVSKAKMHEFLQKHCTDPNVMYIVEDTSLEVIDSDYPEIHFPGPFIKFFGIGPKGDNFEYLVKQYGGQPAIAKAIITFWNREQVHQFTGEVEGTIVSGQDGNVSRGEFGFGWDKQFRPSLNELLKLSEAQQQELLAKYPGCESIGCTFAQLTSEMKSTISHRRRAIASLAEYLKTILPQQLQPTNQPTFKF